MTLEVLDYARRATHRLEEAGVHVMYGVVGLKTHTETTLVVRREGDVVRRAERRVFTLSRTEEVRPEVMRYLNRLSDLLFVVARVLARAEHGTEVLWNRKRA